MIVSHWDQKILNIAVIGFKNSITYMQKQINKILKSFKEFAKVYINNIMAYIKSENFENYIYYLRLILKGV